MTPTRQLLIAYLLAAAFIVAWRWPGLERETWNVDEGFTSVMANVLLDGGTPYKDSIDHRGPVTYFVYALAFIVAGKNNILALHAALLLVVLGVLGLVALLGRQILSVCATIFSLAYFAASSSFIFPPGDLMAFHTEWLVILFTSLGTLLCWHALSHPRAIWNVLSGISFALACFTKQPAGLDVLATLFFLAALALVGVTKGQEVPAKRIVKLVAGIGLGGLLTALLVCSFFYLRGAWSDFVYYFWTYNSSIYLKALPLNVRLSELQGMLRLLLDPVGFAPLAVAGLLSLTGPSGILAVRTLATWKQLHVSLWGVSALAAALVGTRDFAHYFILLFPSWSLLAGMAFDVAISAWRPTVGVESRATRKRVRIAIVLLLLAAVFGRNLAATLRLMSEYRYNIVKWRRIESHDPLVMYIRDQCPPNEKILVWGMMPELYVRSNRNPATRFSYTTFPVGLVPGAFPDSQEGAMRWAVPGALRELVDDIQANRPLFIVDVSQTESQNYICSFILFPFDQTPKLSHLLNSYEPLPDISHAPGVEPGTRVYRRLASELVP